MNYFDNLYVPDPFSGSILKPPAIWLVDPYTWPNKPYVGDTWTTDKWPFDDAKAAPYVPKVPWTEKPSPPDYSWEETRRIIEESKKRAEQQKLDEKYKQAFQTAKSILTPPRKTHKWENIPDGGSKFTLELAGRPKDSVSVEIKDEKHLVVGERMIPKGIKIDGTFNIPSPENLLLDAAQLTMEHGLLTIIFPPKKVEKKVIKLL